MKNGWIKVFGFTFNKTAGGKGYLITTLAIAFAFVALISLGMLFAGSPDDETTQPDAAGTLVFDVSRAAVIGGDIATLTEASAVVQPGIALEAATDMQQAQQLCAGDQQAFIIVIEGDMLKVLLPEECTADMDAAIEYADMLAAEYTSLMSGEIFIPDITLTTQLMGEQYDEIPAPEDELKEIIGFIVPYVVVMLMYFMVLIYGQSVANSAIMEKTSKLMDLFLVSVKPSHLMLGKTLACAAAGILQVLVWILSAICGIKLGGYLLEVVYPGHVSPLAVMLESVGGIVELFDPAAVVLTVLVVIGGFLVYCALAGIGGALAGKPEDLSSTNTLFTFALVISFFACMFGGESAGMISEAAWMAYVPFTAVLVMPARILTGAASLAQGAASVGISAVFAILLCYLAGRVYSAMAFYRGKLIKPTQLIKTLMRK